VRQFLQTNLIRADDGTIKFRINLPGLSRFIHDIVSFPLVPEKETRQYLGPTLFISGRLSGYITDKQRPLIQRLFPNYSLETLEAGHWVQAEKPLEFAQVVTTFLAQHPN